MLSATCISLLLFHPRLFQKKHLRLGIRRPFPNLLFHHLCPLLLLPFPLSTDASPGFVCWLLLLVSAFFFFIQDSFRRSTFGSNSGRCTSSHSGGRNLVAALCPSSFLCLVSLFLLLKKECLLFFPDFLQFQSSNLQVFIHLYLQIFKCSSFEIVKPPNLQTFKPSNLQTFKP